jgi:hypothetical protein
MDHAERINQIKLLRWEERAQFLDVSAVKVRRKPVQPKPLATNL